MANILSFVILLFFLWGRTLYRRNLRLHIFIMVSVIVADLLLIVGLIEKRDALAQVTTDMPMILKIHVPIAVFTVLMYFITAWTGYQLLRGKPVRARMRWCDRILVPSRILTLVTSIMVQFLK